MAELQKPKKRKKRGRPRKRPQNENLKKRWQHKWRLEPAEDTGVIPTRATYDEEYRKQIAEVCGLSQLKRAYRLGYGMTSRQYKVEHMVGALGVFQEFLELEIAKTDEGPDRQAIKLAGKLCRSYFRKRHLKCTLKAAPPASSPYKWKHIEKHWPAFLAEAQKKLGLPSTEQGEAALKWREEVRADAVWANARGWELDKAPGADAYNLYDLLRLDLQSRSRDAALNGKPPPRLYVTYEQLAAEAQAGIDVWAKYYYGDPRKVDPFVEPEGWVPPDKECFREYADPASPEDMRTFVDLEDGKL